MEQHPLSIPLQDDTKKKGILSFFQNTTTIKGNKVTKKKADVITLDDPSEDSNGAMMDTAEQKTITSATQEFADEMRAGSEKANAEDNILCCNSSSTKGTEYDKSTYKQTPGENSLAIKAKSKSSSPSSKRELSIIRKEQAKREKELKKQQREDCLLYTSRCV